MKLIHKGAVLAALAGGIILTAGGVAGADSGAGAIAAGSPGVLSGNVVQIPIDMPLNDCGDSLNLVGILNPAFGNTCANVSDRDGASSTEGSGLMNGFGQGHGHKHSAPMHQTSTEKSWK